MSQVLWIEPIGNGKTKISNILMLAIVIIGIAIPILDIALINVEFKYKDIALIQRFNLHFGKRPYCECVCRQRIYR